MIPIQEHRKPKPFSLFNLGFRPFFLGGAIVSICLMSTWLLFLSKGDGVAYYQTSTLWHSHEMLFGFAFAIVAGFLLTAVRNWTNIQTLYSWPLAALFFVWLCARLIVFLPDLPNWLIAGVDLSFAPLLAFSIAVPVIRSQNYRNLIFVPILIAFFIANLLIHLDLLGFLKDTKEAGVHMALFLIITMITIIGGRVIPFFTERGVSGVSCKRLSFIEKSIIPLTFIWLITSFTELSVLVVLLSIALGISHLVRTWGWFNKAILHTPLVWVLHLGYFFVGLGFLLFAAAKVGFVTQSIATHSFTVGAIGIMTLGMMARVSLGHTGRTLEINQAVKVSFILMGFAAALRIGINLFPFDYVTTINLSGAIWIVAWLIFVARYTSVLVRPRVDGLYG